TIQAVREAIVASGHEVIDLEATSDLPALLDTARPDLVFNMAEGIKGRTRESQVPALLELLDIPYSGSDPAALNIALDKALAKKIVRQHGILTPNFFIMNTGKERLPRDLEFPLIVKPIAEGSSKGVHATSVVERAARECFIALGCRDVARVDFRMDRQGKVYFLECNPLPGLTPGWSDLVLIAKAAGIEYSALISEILSGAIRRYKERERERRS